MQRTTVAAVGKGVRAPRGLRWLALAAVLGPLQFTLTWLVLGYLSTGYTLWDTRIEPYSVIAQPISGLGMGSTAPWMNTSFVLLGLSVIAGMVGIVRSVPGLTAGQRGTCTVALGLLGIGAIVDGVFDLESFFLHFLGFGLVLTPILGFPVVGLLLRRVPRWRLIGGWLLLAGPLSLLLAVLYFATFDPVAAGEGLGVGGLTQRLLVVELLSWYVLLGWFALVTTRWPRTAPSTLSPAAAREPSTRGR